MTELVKKIQKEVIAPAMAYLPANMNSKKSEVQLLAMGLQESRLIHRKQIGGPAKGLWQFEKGGGVKGVMTHRASVALAKEVLVKRGYEASINAAFDAIETDDVLACVFARLLLWTDASPLPELDQERRAWNLYKRVWRPGKPHEAKWPTNYAEALKAVR